MVSTTGQISTNRIYYFSIQTFCVCIICCAVYSQGQFQVFNKDLHCPQMPSFNICGHTIHWTLQPSWKVFAEASWDTIIPYYTVRGPCNQEPISSFKWESQFWLIATYVTHWQCPSQLNGIHCVIWLYQRQLSAFGYTDDFTNMAGVLCY